MFPLVQAPLPIQVKKSTSLYKNNKAPSRFYQ